MGGVGSGEYSRHSKDTTDDYLKLDIRTWHQQRLIYPGSHIQCTWSQEEIQTGCIAAHIIDANQAQLQYYTTNLSSTRKVR